MSRIISLDLHKNLSQTVDISTSFCVSALHAVNNGKFKPFLDEIIPERPQISLYTETKLEVDEFNTFPTLDIALPELIQSSFWQKKYPELSLRKRKINLIEPLGKPFGAVDIRAYKPIPKTRIYADLFTRKISYSFRTHRFARQTYKKIRSHKKFFYRSLATLVLVPILLLFYIKFSVENGYNTLKSLTNAQNIAELQQKTASARGDFERARFLFLPFSWLPFEMVDVVNRATTAGQSVARGIDGIMQTLPKNNTPFSLHIQENDEKNVYRGKSKDIFLGETLGIDLPTNWLEKNKDTILTSIDEFENAGKIYSEVRGNSKYAKIMRQAGGILQTFEPIFEGYKKNNNDILVMLGHRDPQRYIVFNQNRDEIRANGGFPGSIITFTMYKGNILDYRSDDVYYYDWNLYPHKETPPPGLSLLSNNYGLRDVNYYPDFLKTLEKANSFVEKSGDSTLTTGIAINQGVVEEILEVIGKVNVEGVEIPFNYKNFSLLMSMLVENKFAKEKTPKDILFKFIQKFGEQIVETKKIQEVMQVILNNWERGEIMIASRNPTVQGFLNTIEKPLPWDTNEKNWIYPVFTSVSGNKSDRYISRAVETKAKLLEKCRFEVTTKLLLKHNFNEKNEKEIQKYMDTFRLKDENERKKMQFIQGNGENKVFVRLFVPTGAKILTPDINVAEDNYATIFSFMMNTPVGKESEKMITYEQEIPNCNQNETIKVFRQPGLHNLLVP